MSSKDFNEEEAKSFLIQQEKKEKQSNENTRKELLQKAIKVFLFYPAGASAPILRAAIFRADPVISF